MTDTLTPFEISELDQLENEIEATKDQFVRCGKAIMEIRERRLYRKDYSTFEGYCQGRWGWGVRRAQQLARAAEFWESQKRVGAPLPENEAQARQMMKKPKHANNCSPQKLEYVGTENEQKEKLMPARKIPECEVEFVTPPPLPVPAATVKPVQVPISIATHLDAIIREAKRLAESGPSEFKLGAFGHLINELQKLRNGMQMHFTSILDQVPAVKPRSRATKDELQAYCESIGLPADDGEWFYDKMLQSGWKVDGRPVADCYATIRNWKRIGCMASQKPNHYGNKTNAVAGKNGDGRNRVPDYSKGF